MSVANFCRKQRELNMVRLLNAHKSPHTVYEGGMVCVWGRRGVHMNSWSGWGWRVPLNNLSQAL